MTKINITLPDPNGQNKNLEGLLCPICLDLLLYPEEDSITHILCNHFFHTKCIEEWQKENKKMYCQVCHFDESDVQLVMNHANVTRDKAMKALCKNNNDIVYALLELGM